LDVEAPTTGEVCLERLDLGSALGGLLVCLDGEPVGLVLSMSIRRSELEFELAGLLGLLGAECLLLGLVLRVQRDLAKLEQSSDGCWELGSVGHGGLLD
jgi:hypothetical protein